MTAPHWLPPGEPLLLERAGALPVVRQQLLASLGQRNRELLGWLPEDKLQGDQHGVLVGEFADSMLCR